MDRFRLLGCAVAITTIAGLAAVTTVSVGPAPVVPVCVPGGDDAGCEPVRATSAPVADPAPIEDDAPAPTHELAAPTAEAEPAGAETPAADEVIDAPSAEAPDLLSPPTAAELRAARLQVVLDEWLAEQPGVGSVAVGLEVADGLDDPEVPWAGDTTGDGDADVDHDASFPILSVTKTFTESLVLREATAGRIDLDAPVPSGIGGIVTTPDSHAAITPRMLLQHTSGLVNYMSAVGYDPAAAMTPQHAVSLSLQSPLLAEPGARATYSNSNFHWLGLLLEHVTGRPFADLVTDLAATHDLPATHLDPWARPGWTGFASGGIRSTVGDVAHWGSQLFVPGAVLAPEVLAEYLHVGPLGVGLGVWPVCPCTTDPIDGSVDYTAIGQIVADGGMLYFPDDRLVVAVRMERVPGDVGTMTADLADRLRAAMEIGLVSIRAA